jgi:hypothetical protein
LKKNNIFNQIYEKLNSDEKSPAEGVKPRKEEKKEEIEDVIPPPRR